MELTHKTFKQRLDYMRDLLRQTPEKLDELAARLHEKGVECAILMPLMEVVLDYDALMDIAYEQSSETKHGQRFDFLVDDTFLLEAKQLNAHLGEHAEQVERYISKNQKICYGMLTNGVQFQIWLKKSYIEDVAQTSLHHSPAVVKAMEFSLLGQDTDVDFLLSALSVFGKNRHTESFKNVARVAAFYANPRPGKPPNIHDDKNIDKRMKDEIRAAFAVDKGVYYQDLLDKKITSGDRLEFKDDCVHIVVEVTETGTVLLRKGSANVLNTVKAAQAGWAPLITLVMTEWLKEDKKFPDPLDIIRAARDKQHLHNKERYEFKRAK